MKKKILFFLLVLMLHFSVYNPHGNLFDSNLFLFQGSFMNIITGYITFLWSNFSLKVILIILIFTYISESISKIFRRYIYITTRGHKNIFKITLIKNSLISLLETLGIISLIFIIFLWQENSLIEGTLFIIFSFFLTVSSYSLLIILFRLYRISEKKTLFCLISFYLISQFLSFEISLFSVFVISSIHWNQSPLIWILLKLFIFLFLLILVLIKNTSTLILEEST